MPQDAAEDIPAADPATGVPPEPPLFVSRTDPARGTIRVRGHLDRISAEALAGSIAALHRAGHRHVRVQVGPPATVDGDARRLLADLARQLAAHGVRLTLEQPPLE